MREYHNGLPDYAEITERSVTRNDKPTHCLLMWTELRDRHQQCLQSFLREEPPRSQDQRLISCNTELSTNCDCCPGGAHARRWNTINNRNRLFRVPNTEVYPPVAMEVDANHAMTPLRRQRFERGIRNPMTPATSVNREPMSRVDDNRDLSDARGESADNSTYACGLCRSGVEGNAQAARHLARRGQG